MKTQLEQPKTPTHLIRFHDIDPVPRIQKTHIEIVRTLKEAIVPRWRRSWLRFSVNLQVLTQKLLFPLAPITFSHLPDQEVGETHISIVNPLS